MCLFSDAIYQGRDNLIIWEQDYTMTFLCQFELEFYPFDIQECYLKFILLRMTEELGVLVQVFFHFHEYSFRRFSAS